MKTKNFMMLLNIFVMILGAYLAFYYLGKSTPPVLSGLAFIFLSTINLLQTWGDEHTNKRRKN